MHAYPQVTNIQDGGQVLSYVKTFLIKICHEIKQNDVKIPYGTSIYCFEVSQIN